MATEGPGRSAGRGLHALVHTRANRWCASCEWLWIRARHTLSLYSFFKKTYQIALRPTRCPGSGYILRSKEGFTFLSRESTAGSPTGRFDSCRETVIECGSLWDPRDGLSNGRSVWRKMSIFFSCAKDTTMPQTLNPPMTYHKELVWMVGMKILLIL